MYAVRINNDNSVSTLVNQRIYQGYTLSDWFWFFTEPFYNNKKISESIVTIQFTLPSSKKVVNEKIILKDNFYDGYLKYSISSKSKITKESGIVLAKIIFSDSNGNIVRETSEFKVPISTTVDWHNDDSYNGSSGGSNSDSTGGNCNCDSEEHIKDILLRTRPLVFESVNDAESQLNSGKINNIYYGQSIVVKINGKYLSYTIQEGENGYIVEPVDTIGEGTDGIFWQDK